MKRLIEGYAFASQLREEKAQQLGDKLEEERAAHEASRGTARTEAERLRDELQGARDEVNALKDASAGLRREMRAAESERAAMAAAAE